MSRSGTAIAAFAASLPLLALARAATYHPWADVDAIEYARGAVLALAIALGAWVAVRVTIPIRPRAWAALPWLTALAVIAPTNLVHFARITHPAAQARQVTIEDDFERGGAPNPQTWIVQVQGQASATLADGAVSLVTEGGGAAYLDLVTPDVLNPSLAEIWLPRGLYADDFDERLEWEASVRVTSEFSVMLETRHLLIQATPYGLHLTYPDLQRRITQHHMELPEINDGAVRRFTLERTSGLIRLRIGDASGWAFPEAGRFGTIRFGETRPDPLHAGTLSLHSARYVRRYHGA